MAVQRRVYFAVFVIAAVGATLHQSGSLALAVNASCPHSADVRATAYLMFEEDPNNSGFSINSKLLIEVPLAWSGSAQLLSEEPPQSALQCLPHLHLYSSDGPDVEYHSELRQGQVVLTSSVIENYSAAQPFGGYSDDIWDVSSFEDAGRVSVEFHPYLPTAAQPQWISAKVHLPDPFTVISVSPIPDSLNAEGDISWNSPTLRASARDWASAPTILIDSRSVPTTLSDDDLSDLWMFDAIFGLAAYSWTFALFRRREPHPSLGMGRLKGGELDDDLMRAGRLLSIGGMISSIASLAYFNVGNSYWYLGPAADVVAQLVIGFLLLRAYVCFRGGWPRLWTLVGWVMLAVAFTILDFYSYFALSFNLLVFTLLPSSCFAISRRLRDELPVGMAKRVYSRRTRPNRLGQVAAVCIAALAAVSLTVGGGAIEEGLAVHLVMLLTVGALLIIRSGASLFRIVDQKVLVILLAGLAMASSLWSDTSGLGVEQGLALALLASWASVSFLFALRRFSILQQIGGEDAIGRCSPLSLENLQRDFVDADRQLKRVLDDIGALEKTAPNAALSSADKRVGLQDLDEQAVQLRSIPPRVRILPGPTNRFGKLRELWPFSSQSSRTRREGQVNSPATVGRLPAHLNPVDVALAFGPMVSAAGNGRLAMKLLGIGSAVTIGYAIWAAVHADSIAQLARVPSFILNELGFWLGYGMCFGLVWAVLPGRRGSTRALYAFTIYAPELGVVLGMDLASNQPVPTSTLLRGSVLVIALLVCGVTMDLWVLRSSDHGGHGRRTAVAFVADYFRLNKILPIATLILPLIAAVVGIVTQLQRSPSPVPQQDPQTSQSSPSVAPTTQ